MIMGRVGSLMKYSSADNASTNAMGTPTIKPPIKPVNSKAHGATAYCGKTVFQPHTAAAATQQEAKVSHVVRVAPVIALATATAVISMAPSNTGNTLIHCGKPIGVVTLAESSSNSHAEYASPPAVPAMTQ